MPTGMATAYDLTVGVVVNMDETIYMLSPQDTPLLTGMGADGLTIIGSAPVDEIQFSWMDDSILTPRSSLNGAITTGDTVFTLATGDRTKFSTGDIITVGDGSPAQNTISVVPHDLIVDRVYVHGDISVGQKRGIAVALRKAKVELRKLERLTGAGRLSRDTLERRVQKTLAREHLARFVVTTSGNAAYIAATQWLERTLDDSANRRLAIPDQYLTLDGMLVLVENVASGLVVNHAVIRRRLDEHFTGRMLLAEANQWPEDVVPYFGDGDECHMAFHFPVMPRMFMAARREEATPTVEILESTPPIPEVCQWGIFLRNHDELTLEMVTDEERDCMYSEYARDPRMRANVGIRRRLAPLLDNSRDTMELFHALLLSLPGSPVLYYGDEIGMGDNIYLGDRDGVRTPMQWSGDRNAGFSRADFPQLYLPLILDPVYTYEAVNVEAQQRHPSSLLHWVRNLVHVRKRHPVFGTGRFKALRTSNDKVLAFLREDARDTGLVVANLAASAQPVELDLSRYAGRVPVELLGGTRFPVVGELSYLLTLAPHGFFWFQLTEAT